MEPGKKVDLYNTVTQKFIARNISTTAPLKLAAQNAAVIVYVPAAGKISYDGNKMLVDGVVVDYKFQQKK